MASAPLEKPATVETAARILYLVMAIGVGRVVLAVIRHADVRSPDFLIFKKLLVYGLAIFLISQLGKGKNWARWALAAILVVGVPLTILPALDGMSHSPFSMSLILLQAALYFAAMALLFREPASTWFGEQRVSQ